MSYQVYRKVYDLKHIRKLTEADFDEVFALSEFAFQYKLSSDDLLKRKNEAKDHTILGWMDGNELAGKVHIIPFESFINGKVIKMGGIASVATWPEYRRQGIIKQLLYQSLLEMKRSGQIVSFLHPFSFSFYRKFGWEYTFTNKHYDIPIEHLKQKWDSTGYVRRIQKDVPLLNKIYTEYAEQYTGMLKRSEQWWEYRVLDEDLLVSVAYNNNDKPEGYIVFEVKNRIFTVKEMIYTTLNGQKLLLEFIANHDSMVHQVKLVVPENDQLPLLLREPRFKQQLYPYFMARIVDVLPFLEKYPFNVDNNVSRLFLQITDDFFAVNNGLYQLIFDDNNVNVLREDQVAASNVICCTIQQLTSLLLGFKRPLELYNLGLIKGNFEQINQLEHIIPEQQTFLLDFF